MGGRGHNRHEPKRGGLLCPFRGELGPRLTQCGLGGGLLPYQVACHIRSPVRPAFYDCSAILTVSQRQKHCSTNGILPWPVLRVYLLSCACLGTRARPVSLLATTMTSRVGLPRGPPRDVFDVPTAIEASTNQSIKQSINQSIY